MSYNELRHLFQEKNRGRGKLEVEFVLALAWLEDPTMFSKWTKTVALGAPLVLRYAQWMH